MSNRYSRLKQWLREALCVHEWRVSIFQALGEGLSYKCNKCGKYVHK